jgi:hypothetical protein
VSAPGGSPRYFSRRANRRDAFSQLSDFFLGQRCVCRSREHAQNLSAPRAGREMAFPLRRFGRPERLLRIGCNDLGVWALLRAFGSYLVEGFAHAPGKRFLAPPDFGFISVL